MSAQKAQPFSVHLFPRPRMGRRRRQTQWATASAMAWALFLAITYLVMTHQTETLDQFLIVAAAHARVPVLTLVLRDVTALGSTSVVVIMAASFAIVLFLVRQILSAVEMAVAVTGARLLVSIAKYLVARPRPEEALHLVQISGDSYPSGHAVMSSAAYLAAAFIALRLLRRRRSGRAILLIAVVVVTVVCLSRVYLGVHYPADVVGGAALGTAWTLSVTAWIARAKVLRGRTASSPSV